MIQCKFGELSRQASLLRHKGFWPVLSFLSQLFLSVFLVALVFCPSYLIISHLAGWWEKRSQAVRRCSPFCDELPWMMVFQGCEKYWRKIATDIQLSQHAATGERFLPVILLPVSSLSFRLPGRSCNFLPILTCESFFAYGKGLQNLAMITKFITKYNTIFYCGVFFTDNP